MCKTELPRVAKLKERLGDRIEFLMVNVWINESREKIDRYLAEKRLNLPSVIDTEAVLMRAFSILATPTQIIIDKRGRIRYVDPAVPDDIDAHMDELLK